MGGPAQPLTAVGNHPVLTLRLKRRLTPFTLDVNLECRYAVTAIFGPSGAGKSTLLNTIAGVDRPDEGEIAIDGEVLFSSAAGIDLPPERRGIGYVFQDNLLFPHLTVEANLRYGYQLLPPARRRFRFDHIADLLELGPLLQRRTPSLSGGERQRVALGRALLTSPRLLLMDEPLASLDQGLKSRIIPYLRHIRTDLQIPILYVSHSVAEILELTGQVIVLRQGQVVAHGDFFRIATHPGVLPLVEQHGFENVLPVEVLESDGGGRRGVSGVRVVGSDQPLTIPSCQRPAGSKLFVGIRADDVVLSRQLPRGMSVRNALRGQITGISHVAGMELLYIDVGRRLAAKITADAFDELGLQVGETVYCLIKTHSIRIGPEMD